MAQKPRIATCELLLDIQFQTSPAGRPVLAQVHFPRELLSSPPRRQGLKHPADPLDPHPQDQRTHTLFRNSSPGPASPFGKTFWKGLELCLRCLGLKAAPLSPQAAADGVARGTERCPPRPLRAEAVEVSQTDSKQAQVEPASNQDNYSCSDHSALHRYIHLPWCVYDMYYARTF